MISVRHPNIGVLRRIFPASGTMNSVYDWVGSLSCFPMHFMLFANQDKPLRPEEKATRYEGVFLKMVDTEESVWFEEDQEISCAGYESKNPDFESFYQTLDEHRGGEVSLTAWSFKLLWVVKN